MDFFNFVVRRDFFFDFVVRQIFKFEDFKGGQKKT